MALFGGPNGLMRPGIAAAEPQNALAPRPTAADAYDTNAQAVERWLTEQQQISADRGLWQGGSVLEGGGPTGAGWVDAAGQTANALLMGTTAPGIRAYHGSPHSFDRFDTSRIGTGEGAQAYGHGLYFAEREGVAKSYRDELSAKLNPTESAEYLAASKQRAATQAELDALHNKMVQDSLKQGAKLDPEWGELGVTPLPHIVEQYKPQWDAATSRLTSAHDEMQRIITGPRPKGSMYEVQINANPEHMLHWDKPLSEQSPHVQAAVAKITPQPLDGVVQLPNGRWAVTSNGAPTGRADGWPDRATAQYVIEASNQEAKRVSEMTGERLHNYLRLAGDKGGAAEKLRDAGIPGIRYLDQGSRGAGEGSHNLVVFDDATIEVLRKYGLAGLMLGGGAAAGAQGSGE